MTDFQKYLQQMVNQEQEALDAAKASGASQEVVDAIERRKNSFEQQLKENTTMKTINGMSVERYLAAQLLSNSSLKGKKYYDKEDEYTSIIEQNKHLFTEKDDIVQYESNTKGKEAFVKEALTPIVQQYGYSVASYTGEDGKDEKVWLFKRSNRKIGLIDDAQFAVDVTADSITALFEDVLRRIGVIPETRYQKTLIMACLDYIQNSTENSLEFLKIMKNDLLMTDDEIEEYGKGYCLDTSEYED